VDQVVLSASVNAVMVDVAAGLDVSASLAAMVDGVEQWSHLFERVWLMGSLLRVMIVQALVTLAERF
jgi:hypothetical protein